jgi:uncharacterized protein YutE (UPF0331/DUF86 family)
MSRIEEKISDVKKYLKELAEIMPVNFEEYSKSNLIKAACERYVEKIIEGIIDVAFILIRMKKFELPEDDIDAFRILLNHKIVNEGLYQKLKLAKGMRNILVHEYGKIDDKIIFDSISEDLNKDVTSFLEELEKSR